MTTPSQRVDPSELERMATAAARAAHALRSGMPGLTYAWQRTAVGLAGTATGSAMGVSAGRAAAVMQACADATEAYAQSLASAAVRYREADSMAVPVQRTARP